MIWTLGNIKFRISFICIKKIRKFAEILNLLLWI